MTTLREQFENILKRKEEHYKLREKLVINEVKKDFRKDLINWARKMEREPWHSKIDDRDLQNEKIGYNNALIDLIDYLKDKP